MFIGSFFYKRINITKNITRYFPNLFLQHKNTKETALFLVENRYNYFYPYLKNVKQKVNAQDGVFKKTF